MIILILGLLFYVFQSNKNTQVGDMTPLDVNENANKQNGQLKAEPYVFTADDLKTDGVIYKDSNNDGLTDEQAKKLGLDPSKTDTDGDGVFDIDEINITKTDPLKADTDGDGVKDGEAIRRDLIKK